MLLLKRIRRLNPAPPQRREHHLSIQLFYCETRNHVMRLHLNLWLKSWRINIAMVSRFLHLPIWINDKGYAQALLSLIIMHHPARPLPVTSLNIMFRGVGVQTDSEAAEAAGEDQLEVAQ